MSIKNRLAQLEKQRAAQPQNKISIIEIVGTRPDGSQYAIETWKQLVEADEIEPREVWKRFVNDSQPEQETSGLEKK